MSASTSSTRAPIVIIGLDSCDADLMQYWMGEGRLPFLASLLERDSFVRLDSTRCLFSDAPWPSFNAGVNPAKHAFYNYLQLKRGTTWIERVDAHHCRDLPFWSHLRGTGMKVATLDVPKTFPIEGLEGVQICAWGEHYPLLADPVSAPPSAVRDIVRRFGRYPHPREIIDPRSRKQERRIYQTISKNLERKRQATEYLIDLDAWDLFVSVFSEVHEAGHQFYHHYDVEHWAHDPATPNDLQEALPRLYAQLDAALASVFEHLPEEATYFVLSVHGLAPNFSATPLIFGVLEKLGYLVPAQHPEPEDMLDQVLQWTRRLRALIPQRVRQLVNTHLIPQAAHDRAHASAFSHSIDWNQTRAFPLESDHFQAFISVNLKGREPHGIVERGQATDALCDELSAELKRLVNPATGRSAVQDVVRIADVYQGPNFDELPELAVQWADEKPIEALHHPRFGTISMEGFPLRKTQHAPDGFLIAGGPHIKATAEIPRASTLDIAPTILHLLGPPLPEDRDGHVLSDLLAATPPVQQKPTSTFPSQS